jgi:hypothetical protein
MQTKGEILATIERRFQFVIILALFLPVVWGNVSEILKGVLPSVVYSQLSFGIIISYIITSYLILEIFKNEIDEKNLFLSLISGILLIISFALVIIISFSFYPQSKLVGGFLFMLKVASVLVPFTCLSLSLVMVYGLTKTTIQIFKRELFK